MRYGRINIEDLEVYAKHGVFEEENRLGQKFLFSLTLYVDTMEAGNSDDLSKSVNYGEVCHFIKEWNEKNTFMLIERVAEVLSTDILNEFPLIHGLDIEVKKPWAPIGLPVNTVSVSIHREWHKAYIALGSNMGDSRAIINNAIERLGTHPKCRVGKVSSIIITKPYGGVEQDDFYNGALELDTMMEPEELLEYLNKLEHEANRVREIHWGPRTLDLDILFYDNDVIDTEKLHVPHIDLHNRDFVLIPMNEIAPWLRHPLLNKTINEMLEDMGK